MTEEITAETSEIKQDVSEDSSPQVVEQETQEEKAQDAPEEEKPRKGKNAKQRIGQLISERNAERRQREELERKLQDYQSSKPLDAPSVPNEMDYDDPDQYRAALDQYITSKTAYEVERSDQARRQSELAEQNKRLARERAEKFISRCEELSPQFEDFDGVMNDPGYVEVINSFDQNVLGLIQESDKGPALAYHLGCHLDEADRISRLDPVIAARELALIEAGLDLPKPKKVTGAPDPIKPLGTSPSDALDELSDDLPIDKWMEVRNRQSRG